MSLPQNRPLLEDRTIEFDGLAIFLLASAFAGIAALTFWVIASASMTSGWPVYLASGLVGLGTVVGWVFGYPRRAAIPSMSFVVVCAVAWLPFFFDLDGALLREAAGIPASRLHVAAGLYVGGLGLVFLAFVVFGFLGPFVGALLGLRRGVAGARATLVLQIVLSLSAALVMVLSRPAIWS